MLFSHPLCLALSLFGITYPTKHLQHTPLILLNHLLHLCFVNCNWVHTHISLPAICVPCIINASFYSYTPSGKEKKWKNVEKSDKSAYVLSNVLVFFFFKHERTSWSLTPQLDTVIFEVPSVKGISLRGNTLRLYMQGQTFAIRPIWWHRILHWVN